MNSRNKANPRLFCLLVLVFVVGCATLHKTGPKVKEETEEQVVLENVTQEYIGSLNLYYDNGPYVKGPTIIVDTICVVYSCEMITYQDVAISDVFTYYLPLNDSSIMIRRNKYSGQGYHGGHLVILTEDDDHRFDTITTTYFNGGTLVRPKSTDPNAKAFEKYCRQQGLIQNKKTKPLNEE